MSERGKDLGVTPSREPEPWSAATVRRRIRALLDEGKVTVSRHAEKRMAEREVDMVDVLNVLRGGHLSPDKLTTFEHGTWRYTVESTRLAVVVAFVDDVRVVIVTVFRREG